MLVDALEDSSYESINDVKGSESLVTLLERIKRHGKDEELVK